jgi:hypothetical protein
VLVVRCGSNGEELAESIVGPLGLLGPDVTADIALRGRCPLCRQGKKPETGYREVVGRCLNRLANRL